VKTIKKTRKKEKEGQRKGEEAENKLREQNGEDVGGKGEVKENGKIIKRRLEEKKRSGRKRREGRGNKTKSLFFNGVSVSDDLGVNTRDT
jgi:hypothetical protein